MSTLLANKITVWLTVLVGAVFIPVVPHILFCFSLIIIDAATAIGLSFRVRKRYPDAARAPLRSSGLGRVAITMLQTMVFLLIANCVDILILNLSSNWAVRITCGLITVWQSMSIVENLISCNDRRLCRTLRRFLADKTQRHLQ